VLTGRVSKQELTCESEIKLCLLDNLYLLEFANVHLHLLVDPVYQSRQMERYATNKQNTMISDAISTMQLLFAIFRTSYSLKLSVRSVTSTELLDSTLQSTLLPLLKLCHD
jgi:hypothetical protein